MFDLFRKYFNLILAVLFAVGALVLVRVSHYPDFQSEYESFKSTFHSEELKLEHELARAEEIFHSKGIEAFWEDYSSGNEVILHVYLKDSLKYWSSNQVPILRYADIHFPSEGINHLQNGWYYTKIRSIDGVIIAATFLIKSDFSYQNDDLVNAFAPIFDWNTRTTIGIDPEEGYQVNDKNGEYRFSLLPNEQSVVTSYQSISILVLILLAVFMALEGVNILRRRSWVLAWGIPLGVILIRLWSIHSGWTLLLADDYSFSPALYGGNQWVQNIADYLINLLVLAFVVKWLIELVNSVSKRTKNSNALLLLLALSLPIWSLFLTVVRDLIRNSQIPISLNEVFSLDVYSLIVLLGWGMLLFYYHKYLRVIIGHLAKHKSALTQTVFSIFIFGFGYFIWSTIYQQSSIAEGIFPLLAMLGVFFISFRKQESNTLGTGLFQLFLYSSILSVILGIYNQQREREERKLYADQLALDKDVEAEWEFSKLTDGLNKEKLFPKILMSEVNISRSDFQEIMERRFFNGFWERYDMEFDLFYPSGKAVFPLNAESRELDDFDKMIEQSGEVSPLDSSMYYLKNYSSSYNYMVKYPLRNQDTVTAYLVCTLRSKKIPEEIGFPRLLISKDANVLKPLEEYSIAKYNKRRLISQHGDFGFPSTLDVLKENVSNRSYFVAEQFEHYYLERNAEDVILLSRKRSGFYEQLTSFSYLFSLYGIMLLPLLFRVRRKGYKEALTLAMKIQLMLIFIVFIALLGFGFGSGFFIQSQYNEYTNQVITEKLSSVEIEVKSRVGEFEFLTTADNREQLQQILQKIAHVFNTDVNMYDREGYLLATSKPKLFNMGIVSEQINPEAFQSLTLNAKSKYVHQENIGKLEYASAYRPFYNRAGVHLAYINLQHFGKQSELESQIQGLLVAIINIFILLLALTVLLALMVSNWLTIPLRKLQESLVTIRFGKHNEPIPYGGEDEIGSLVKAYNEKLEELAFTAEQLAQSERESAWREMAKQVAHEIKNPLTPMKLSVQQLLRSYDPTDENSKNKLERVAQSIIEQIDALTNIANEFSNFAKLPKLTAQEVELVALTEKVLALFENEYNCTFALERKVDSVFITGDRDQLMRVLNNIIKNAVQAIPADRNGRIEIQIGVEGNNAVLSVKDNGVGISKEQRKNLFVPYFTTKSTGTGLGLAMVKQIIENHHGTITVRSERDAGAEFTIELPLMK